MAEPDPKVAVPLTMRFLACIAETCASGARRGQDHEVPDFRDAQMVCSTPAGSGSAPARRGLTPSGCSGEEGFEARFVLEGADCCQTQLLGCEECGCESSYVFCCHCVE